MPSVISGFATAAACRHPAHKALLAIGHSTASDFLYPIAEGVKAALKKLTAVLVVFSQRAILIICHRFFSITGTRTGATISWVVGVDEVAANVRRISEVIPHSVSISLQKNPYYDFSYDFQLPATGRSGRLFRLFSRAVYGPALLGYLMSRAEGFFYLQATRFLNTDLDQGEFELRYLKTHGKKIALFFVGSEIRSPRLSLADAQRRGDEVIATYLSHVAPHLFRPGYEDQLKRLASISEQYADVIFNFKVDQISYFDKPTAPFLYFYPDRLFFHSESKYRDLSTIKIVHAPSSPVIKGTQLVRAAIAKLRNEGRDFQYVELIDTPNNVVLDELRNAHIVLNEFYSYVPGLFGVEAMASHCALLTSADERIETDLPRHSNQAWLVTKYYEVYTNLRYLLDNPEEIKRYADAGHQWALQHAALSKSGKRLLEIIDQL